MRKYDINLLPRKTGTSDVAKLALSMALVALVMAALLVAGVMYPNMVLQRKEQQKADLLAQVSSYDNVHQEFTDVTVQLKQINGQITNLENFQQYKGVLQQVLSTLEQCSPNTLVLTDIKAAYDKIDCNGKALRDEDVAAFAAKLRATGLFSSVEIVNTDGDNASRTFSITMVYPVAEGSAAENNTAANTSAADSASSDVAAIAGSGSQGGNGK